MSTAFDILPRPPEEQAGITGPQIDPESPGLLKGLTASVPLGIMRGSTNIGIGASLAAANVATLTDAASGSTHYGEWYFNHVVDPLIDTRQRLEKLSANQGAISNVLGGVTGGVLQAGFGGPAGLGISEGVSGAAAESRHSPLATSYEIGAAEGLFSYATARLPMKLPFAAGVTAKTFKNGVYGAFVGGTSAVAEPLAEKFIYTVNGQPDDAKKINIWDARNIVANATLAAFFGTFGKHPASPLVDAALNQNDVEARGKTAAGAVDPAAGATAVAGMEKDVASGVSAVDAAKQHEVPLSDTAIEELRRSAQEATDGLPKDSPKPSSPMGAPEQSDASPEAVEVPKPGAEAETAPGEEKPPEWSPTTEEGEQAQTSYGKVQKLADYLDAEGATDESGRKAGDILRESMDMMRASKNAQSVMDSAAQCILGALNG